MGATETVQGCLLAPWTSLRERGSPLSPCLGMANGARRNRLSGASSLKIHGVMLSVIRADAGQFFAGYRTEGESIGLIICA